MSYYYITQGDVRGRCPHNHRTISGAVRCLERDQVRCRQQGGYSDRNIYRMPDGALIVGDADEGYMTVDEWQAFDDDLRGF